MQPHLDFEDLLRVQTGGVDNTYGEQVRAATGIHRSIWCLRLGSPTLGLIPPTPQDLFSNADFAQFTNVHAHTYQEESLTSPPPIDTGIVTQDAQQPFKGHARSDSLEAPRHSSISNWRPTHARTRSHPYQQSSRQSSSSSTANESFVSDSGSDWQRWGSSPPALSRNSSPQLDAGCIGGEALLQLCADSSVSGQQSQASDRQRLKSTGVSASSEAGPLPHGVGASDFGQSNQYETQDRHRQHARPAPPSLHQIHRERDSLALNRTRRQIPRNRCPSKDPMPRKAAASSSTRRPVVAEEQPILVTAITKSGKKSHARKVRASLWLPAFFCELIALSMTAAADWACS